MLFQVSIEHLRGEIRESRVWIDGHRPMPREGLCAQVESCSKGSTSLAPEMVAVYVPLLLFV